MNTSSLKDRRLRAFVLERGTGKPLPGVPVLAVAQNKAGQRVPLGLLASDHAGYLSFDVRHLSRLSDVLHIWLYRLGDEEHRIDALQAMQLAPGSGFVQIETDPLPPAMQGIGSHLRAIQSPGLADLRNSPGSFAVNPNVTIGEGACELLVPSDKAVHEFRFRQVLRAPGGARPYGPVLSDPCLAPDEFRGSVCVREGWVNEYKMVWYPEGHALGRLVYSLPLAPCESVNLAVVEWTRRDEAIRREDTTVTESLIHEQRRDRFIEETVGASLEEWQGGGSIMTGAAGTFSAASLPLSISGALGGAYSSSGAERTVEADTTQQLSDRIVQTTDAIRNLYSAIVVKATQEERDAIQTRTVTNHNHCHALTMLYYEVVRHLRVVTEWVGRQEVLLIQYSDQDGRSMTAGFTEQTAYSNRLVLERVLLDRRLRRCFAALAKKHCADAGIVRADAGVGGNYFIDTVSVVVETGEQEPDESFSVRLTTGSGSVYLEGLDPQPNQRFPRWFSVPSSRTAKFLTLRPATAVRWSEIVSIQISLGDDEGPWDLAHLYVATSQGAETWILYDTDVNQSIERGGSHTLNVTPPSGGGAEFSLTAEELCCVSQLLVHLNANRVHYNRAIRVLEDAHQRAIRFDAIAYGEGRLLDSIENRPLAVYGDYVAFPRLGNGSGAEDAFEADDAIQERWVVLPTRGVFAEAQLSHCNVCEERDITRFWNWSESPCPEKAPEITGIQPGSRAEQPELTPTTLPTPVVNIVNPPAAPDPTGLAAVMSLLATPNVFRDMSGLQEVSGLLQKLAGGTISLEQARKTAAEIQNRQGGGAQDGLEGLTPEEQHDQNQVTRNAGPEGHGELTEAEVRDRVRDATRARRGRLVDGEGDGEETPPPSPPDLRPVDIRLRAFVPSEIWEPGFGFPVLGLAHAALLAIRFNGDHREFSPDQGTSRVDLPVRLQLNASDMSIASSDEGGRGAFGEAAVYLATGTEDVEGQPEWCERLGPDTRPLLGLVGRLERTPENLQATVTSQAGSVVVRLKVSARQYFPFAEDVIALLPDLEIDLAIASFDVKDVLRAILHAGLPDMDADIRITISKREDGELQYHISGTHDGFPAWELYVNGETAYTFDPRVNIAEPDLAPELLVGPGDQRVARATAPLRRID